VRSFLTNVLLIGPITCWGLIAYSIFLHREFGDPFAFLVVQGQWAVRPDLSPLAHALSCIALQPFWDVFVPSSPAYWARHDPTGNPVFSLQFANPIYLAVSAGLVILGWRKRWLSSYELLASAGLLLIPYVSHSYRNAMISEGRYASVVFPAYIVMAHLLARCPAPVVALLCGISGFMLGAYSALFATWHQMI
jgi:hypothetical protein